MPFWMRKLLSTVRCKLIAVRVVPIASWVAINMRWSGLLSLIVFVVATDLAPAAQIEWRRFVIPQTGASVDIPISIFSEPGELPNGGVGRAFFTADRRADLTVQSIRTDDSPGVFLTKRNPPPGIEYKRVTPKFFAVSSVRGDRTWYNRCNKSGAYLNCILINYPRAEERKWDNVVTRISLTLSK